MADRASVPRSLIKRWGSLVAGALALLSLAAVEGCNSDDEGASANGSAPVAAVDFRANMGTSGRTILSMGGLELRGTCRDISGEPLLLITARTTSDDGVIGSWHGEVRRDGGSVAETMTQMNSSFGPADGQFRVVEPTYNDFVGALTYTAPQDGHVSMNYLGAYALPQADCAFIGTAQHIPYPAD